MSVSHTGLLPPYPKEQDTPNIPGRTLRARFKLHILMARVRLGLRRLATLETAPPDRVNKIEAFKRMQTELLFTMAHVGKILMNGLNIRVPYLLRELDDLWTPDMSSSGDYTKIEIPACLNQDYCFNEDELILMPNDNFPAWCNWWDDLNCPLLDAIMLDAQVEDLWNAALANEDPENFKPGGVWFTIIFDNIPGTMPRSIDLYPPPIFKSGTPDLPANDSPASPPATVTQDSAMPHGRIIDNPDDPALSRTEQAAMPTDRKVDQMDDPHVTRDETPETNDCMRCLELLDVLRTTKDLLIDARAAVCAKLGETREAVQESAHAIGIYDTLEKITREQGNLFGPDGRVPARFRDTIPPAEEDPQFVPNVRFQPFREDRVSQLAKPVSDPSKNRARSTSSTTSSGFGIPGPSSQTAGPSTHGLSQEILQKSKGKAKETDAGSEVGDPTYVCSSSDEEDTMFAGDL